MKYILFWYTIVNNIEDRSALIELQNISLNYKEKIIFQGFNLHIKAKERFVLLGESGRGKSTLLRLIAGLLVPDKGKIYIDGTLVTEDKNIIVEPHKRRVSMLFQDLALWPHMNVAQNIAFALKMQKQKKEAIAIQVKKMLSLVKLEGYERRDVTTLSGGEQQRVALARSLAPSPQILLMDEPLSSLDNKNNHYLREQIITLQKELHFTLVYVTHNLEEAEVIATNLLEI